MALRAINRHVVNGWLRFLYLALDYLAVAHKQSPLTVRGISTSCTSSLIDRGPTQPI